MDSERVVSNADGKATSAKFNIGFIESSAKTNINVQEIFFELVRMINKWLDCLFSFRSPSFGLICKFTGVKSTTRSRTPTENQM